MQEAQTTTQIPTFSRPAITARWLLPILALQVLDRWHLIGNAREALSRVLDRLRSRLQRLLTVSADEPVRLPAVRTLSLYDRERRRGTKDQLGHQQSRAQRYQVYAEVRALHPKGM